MNKGSIYEQALTRILTGNIKSSWLKINFITPPNLVGVSALTSSLPADVSKSGLHRALAHSSAGQEYRRGAAVVSTGWGRDGKFLQLKK